jgi:predicted nucleic acid-binding protein
VLDASVAFAWCFEDETTPETEAVLDRLDGDPALVPAVWELEITNGLLVGERRGRLSEAQSARFVSLLAALPINVEPTCPGMTTLLAVGRQHGLSSDDSSYLVLAERDGHPLATLDGKLVAAARAAGCRSSSTGSDQGARSWRTMVWSRRGPTPTADTRAPDSSSTRAT